MGLGGKRFRWVAVAVAVALVPSVAVGATLAQSPAPPDRAAVTRVQAQTLAEPTPPAPAAPLDPSVFRAAAKRPPAAPVLTRLPQVDLNGLSVAGVPKAALRAYVTAARLADAQDPTCHLRWWLLAGIGLVESAHGRSGGSAAPGWNGIATPPIFGPRLDGKHGYAAIHDTDHGVLDQDKKWDRAVGPMQFLPQTWQRWGGTTHGRPRNPQDIRAAALAAAGYLCAGSANVSQPQGLATAVFSYNHSFDYVRLVLTVAARYAGVDPRSLGVDRLPHDKIKKHKKHKRQAPRATPARTSPSTSTIPPVSTAPVPTASGETSVASVSSSPAPSDNSPVTSPPPSSSPAASSNDTSSTPASPNPTDTPTVATT